MPRFTRSLLLTGFALFTIGVFAQRKGQRINRWSFGATYGKLLSGAASSNYKPGFFLGYTNSRPILLNRIQRHNGLPLFYVNGGLSLFSTGAKNISSLHSDTLLLQDYNSSLMYAALPLSVEINLYKNKSAGQVKQSNASVFSILGGAQFTYLLTSTLSGSPDMDFKGKTSPYDIQWFAGVRLLGTMQGISLDLDYVKGIQPLYTGDGSSRSQFFVVRLTMNRLESNCRTSNRKRGHLFAV
jgi:hypothetical protein